MASHLHEEISRLELLIEELARSLERSRKIILVSRIAIAAGALWMLALVFNALSMQPLSLIGAITVTLGGIVAYGSNMSTRKQQVAALEAAESSRTELIGKLDLTLIGQGSAGSGPETLLSGARGRAILNE